MWKYIARLKDSIINSDPAATKFQTYRALKPNLDPHSLYIKNAPVTPDYLQITFTRYRLSSHRLRIEMGR